MPFSLATNSNCQASSGKTFVTIVGESLMLMENLTQIDKQGPYWLDPISVSTGPKEADHFCLASYI